MSSKRELAAQWIHEDCGPPDNQRNADPDYRLRVNGDTILNGLAKVISTLFLEALGGNLHLRTAADKSILGLTATQLRDELSVHTKAQVDSLLAGKANTGHTH